MSSLNIYKAKVEGIECEVERYTDHAQALVSHVTVM